MRGRFIVIEGADGVGKSTQARLLYDSLTAAGGTVRLTGEPTRALPTGKLLRGMLVDPCASYDWRTLSLLFAADRHHHVASEIYPAIKAGEVVICERFIESTLIYQTAALYAAWEKSRSGLDRDEYFEAHRWIRALHSRMMLPDLTVVLDAPEEEMEQRLAERTAAVDEFEKDAELQKTVRALYRERPAYSTGAFEIVSASGSKEEVAKRVLTAVLKRIDWSEDAPR